MSGRTFRLSPYFNSRPREGANMNACQGREVPLISIHAPARGQTCFPDR